MKKLVWFLLLLTIPTQLGRHFWPDWSYLMGIRIDYLSPTLYLVDILWLGLFLTETYRNKTPLSRLKSRHLPLKKGEVFNKLLIGIFILVNILLARNMSVAIYKWLRIGELLIFVYLVFKNKRLIENLMIWVLPVWIVLESLLAVGQISKGGSLNGIWWWLGERSFDFNTIGIAQMSVAGSGLVRAYGTFSHPNSLAGFLLVGWIWWWKYKEKVNNLWWWGVNWLGLMGIILTGSRTVWLLTGLVLIWKMIKKIQEKKLNSIWKWVVGVLIVVIMVLKIVDFNYPMGNFLGGWDENGWIKRGQLSLGAWEMIKKSPWVGVGMGNYLVNLPEFQRNNQIFWLQPVHNIILLVLAEVGLLGSGMLVWLITEKWRNKKWEENVVLILLVIFLTGMMDHYWLTLPQNMWLLALLLGMI